MQQPLRLLAGIPSADEREPHSAERAARATLRGEDHLVVAPLLEFVAAVVPDRHVAAAVLAARDRALEAWRTPWGGPRSGWRGCCASSCGGMPRGTAQLASTPSRSSRRSQCSAVAWCSWMTKRGSSAVGRWSRRADSRAPVRASVRASASRCRWRADLVGAPRPPAWNPSGSSGSPIASARSSTSSQEQVARDPGSSSSSHVRGAATVGRARPRSEYGAIVVFAPLFWLQSMNTRPPRMHLRHLLTTRSG